MIISDLIYQSDEYMEKTMKLMVHDNQDALGDFIREQCGCQNMWLRSGFPRRETAAIGGLKNLKEVHKSPKNNSMILKEAKSVLGTMIAYVLQQPALLRRPSWQRLVAQELCGFLLAHIRHVRYNDQFFQQASLTGQPSLENRDGIDTFHNPEIAYFEWVHTLATDDISCPFAFAVFLVLLEEREPLETLYAKYTAQTLCMHLGRMCRQYNDYGSLARDQEERNLNSLNFPEFCGLGVKEGKEELIIWLSSREKVFSELWVP